LNVPRACPVRERSLLDGRGQFDDFGHQDDFAADLSRDGFDLSLIGGKAGRAKED